MPDEDFSREKCKAGAPVWVTTFADLMSLLLCFFVLLLSFATIDAVRFRQMAASLKNAFGVQREVPSYETVKGTSIVAQHFSPATPEPTPSEDVRQTTTEERPHLKIPENTQLTRDVTETDLERQRQLEREAEKIRHALRDEISEGLISVETRDHRIIIRIHEKGSFPSGSAVLNTDFEPVMRTITETVRDSNGKVVVAGHTDNVPIATVWYRSNWELSAARAVTVVHEILKDQSIDPNRIVIEGHADTRPLVPNDSKEHLAKNRRVEIILIQGDDNEKEQSVIQRRNE